MPIQYRNALAGGNDWSTGRFTGLYAPRQSYLTVGLKGFVNFNQYLGCAAYISFMPHARNIAAAPSMGLSFHYKWGD